MARAVFYGRFSSNNQREESIDAQLRAVEDFASESCRRFCKKEWL